MSKKNEKKYSNAGKGDKSRVSNKKKYDKNYEKIFGMDIRRANGNGSQLGLSNPRYEGDGTEWIVEKDEDVDGKNLGYLDGEDLNTDVEGYNAKLVRVLHQESDVIDRRIV